MMIMLRLALSNYISTCSVKPVGNKSCCVFFLSYFQIQGNLSCTVPYCFVLVSLIS